MFLLDCRFANCIFHFMFGLTLVSCPTRWSLYLPLSKTAIWRQIGKIWILHHLINTRNWSLIWSYTSLTSFSKLQSLHFSQMMFSPAADIKVLEFSMLSLYTLLCKRKAALQMLEAKTIYIDLVKLWQKSPLQMYARVWQYI